MTVFILDSDVVIWHLRGNDAVVQQVTGLAGVGRLAVSAITRAEVLVGMRPTEEQATVNFLDACETVPVDADVADCAGVLVRRQKKKGITIHLPDALIAATAILKGSPLHTCNPRHYPYKELEVVEVPVRFG